MTDRKFLLSGQGERHEDRLPYGIFDTEQEARDHVALLAVHELGQTVTVSEEVFDGDYGRCVLFSATIGEGDDQESVVYLLDQILYKPTSPNGE